MEIWASGHGLESKATAVTAVKFHTSTTVVVFIATATVTKELTTQVLGFRSHDIVVRELARVYIVVPPRVQGWGSAYGLVRVRQLVDTSTDEAIAFIALAD
jgi:hypothetical protein